MKKNVRQVKLMLDNLERALIKDPNLHHRFYTTLTKYMDKFAVSDAALKQYCNNLPKDKPHFPFCPFCGRHWEMTTPDQNPFINYDNGAFNILGVNILNASCRALGDKIYYTQSRNSWRLVNDVAPYIISWTFISQDNIKCKAVHFNENDFSDFEIELKTYDPPLSFDIDFNLVRKQLDTLMMFR